MQAGYTRWMMYSEDSRGSEEQIGEPVLLPGRWCGELSGSEERIDAFAGCFEAETDWSVELAAVSVVDRTVFQSWGVMPRVRSLGYEMRKPSLLLERRIVDVLLPPDWCRVRTKTNQEMPASTTVPADHVRLGFNAPNCHC